MTSKCVSTIPCAHCPPPPSPLLPPPLCHVIMLLGRGGLLLRSTSWRPRQIQLARYILKLLHSEVYLSSSSALGGASTASVRHCPPCGPRRGLRLSGEGDGTAIYQALQGRVVLVIVLEGGVFCLYDILHAFVRTGTAHRLG